ncbi:unnamed protein product [Discosporangium mesarthrocarpum]
MSLMSFQYSRGKVIDWTPTPSSSGTYTGATVFEPVTGLFDEIKAYDFASFYPSIILCANVSKEIPISSTSVLSSTRDGIVDWSTNNVSVGIEEHVDVYDLSVDNVTKNTMQELINIRMKVGKKTPQGWALHSNPSR